MLHHINLKDHHSERLKRLCKQEELTQPQLIAKALAVYEESLKPTKETDK